VTFSFYPVILTFDLWPWTFAMFRLWRAESLYQIWTQSINLRWSYCDFNIWSNDIERGVTYCALLWDIFKTFDLRQLVRAWIIAFCDADTLCYAVSLTFDPLTLRVRGTSSVMCSKFVRNLSEIEQSPAELLIILRIFAHIMSLYDFDLWPLDLNFYSPSDVIRLNSVQNLSESE